mgnify:CR=1 FL=1
MVFNLYFYYLTNLYWFFLYQRLFNRFDHHELFLLVLESIIFYVFSFLNILCFILANYLWNNCMWCLFWYLFVWHLFFLSFFINRMFLFNIFIFLSNWRMIYFSFSRKTFSSILSLTYIFLLTWCKWIWNFYSFFRASSRFSSRFLFTIRWFWLTIRWYWFTIRSTNRFWLTLFALRITTFPRFSRITALALSNISQIWLLFDRLVTDYSTLYLTW